MRNPFVYAEAVKGEDFADREEELREIITEIKNSQNIIIYSPRRYGKTSLIKEALRRLENDIIKIYMDLFMVTSRKDLVEKYSLAISEASRSRLQEVVDLVRENIPSLHVSVEFPPGEDPKLKLGVGRSKTEVREDLLSVLRLPQEIAEERNARAVVVFDEFQEIVGLNGEELLKQIRSVVQHHDRVSYIFMGSKSHMFQEIFTEKSNPMYGMGKIFPLGKIPRREFVGFIEEKFDGFSIEEEVLEDLLDITEGHPYYTQQLCHEIWNLCYDQMSIENEHLRIALDLLIKKESGRYQEIWESLTLNQKTVLKAIAKEKTENIFSEEYGEKHGLGKPTSILRAVKSLTKKELVEKNREYKMVDPFMAEWIKLQTI